MADSCSAAGCYLAQKGGLVSFWLITLAGLVDSLNPCAIGVMILLLGFLVVFAQKREKVLPYGLLYILVVYLTYLGIGLSFYRAVGWSGLSPFRHLFNKTLGLGLLAAGLINIKDFVAPHLPGHLEIPKRFKPLLMKLVEKASWPTIIILAFLVTLLEAPCSLPIYAGTATVLAQSGLPTLRVVLYFLYYNFLFVLPLFLILLLVWGGQELAVIKEWEHRLKPKFRLLMGLLLVVMGGWFWLN